MMRMRQIDRQEGVMRTRDDTVSPYLRRPDRTYEQVLQEQAKCAQRPSRRADGSVEPSNRDMMRWDDDDVEPGR